MPGEAKGLAWQEPPQLDTQRVLIDTTTHTHAAPQDVSPQPVILAGDEGAVEVARHPNAEVGVSGCGVEGWRGGIRPRKPWKGLKVEISAHGQLRA